MEKAKSPIQLSQKMGLGWSNPFPTEGITPQNEQVIRYPSGTSKEYSDRINADYEKVIPFLREKGYDIDNFTNDTIDGHFSTNIEEHLRKLFDDHKEYSKNKWGERTPLKEGNEDWNKNWKPTFDALMTALDKYYNDWYIKNAPNGYPEE